MLCAGLCGRLGTCQMIWSQLLKLDIAAALSNQTFNLDNRQWYGHVGLPFVAAAQ